MERANVPLAREIMTRRLVTLRPEMSILEASELLQKHHISGAPVLDADRRLLGLLSEYDCLKAVASADYEMDAHDIIETVGQLMTTTLHTVGPDAGLFALVQIFVAEKIRRLPVVEGEVLVGQVSRRDALGAAIKMRREMDRSRHHYPDYPQGRDPIRDYPRH